MARRGVDSTPEWVLLYLGMVGGSAVMPLVLGIFISIGSLFYTSTHSDWPPLSAEKIGLSLSHLVPEILGSKVCLFFHQNVLLFQFLSWFSIQLTPFSLILDLFDNSFSRNLRSDWVQFLSHDNLVPAHTSWILGRKPHVIGVNGSLEVVYDQKCDIPFICLQAFWCSSLFSNKWQSHISSQVHNTT